MTSLITELQADLQDLENLLKQAQRQRAQDLIRADIERVRILIDKVAQIYLPISINRKIQPLPNQLKSLLPLWKKKNNLLDSLLRISIPLLNIPLTKKANLSSISRIIYGKC